MNELLCAYCNEPIIDEKKSIYKFFPEEGIHKKVHFYHLTIRKEKIDEEKGTRNRDSTVEN